MPHSTGSPRELTKLDWRNWLYCRGADLIGWCPPLRRAWDAWWFDYSLRRIAQRILRSHRKDESA